MIKLEMAGFFALLVLGLGAGFGYYQAFMTLITRRARLHETKMVKGLPALGFGLLYLAGAITASGVAVLFYFSQN
jgi:Na+-transporting NADH:ubiquinone oxidoreductase subunit NqrE